MCVNLIVGTTTDTINSFQVWSITIARHFSSSCDFWKTIRGVTSPGRLRGSTVREFSCPLPQIKKILQEMRLAYRSNSYFIAFEIVRTYLRYWRKTIRTIATRRINSTMQCCMVHCYCFIIFSFSVLSMSKKSLLSRKTLWIQKSSTTFLLHCFPRKSLFYWWIFQYKTVFLMFNSGIATKMRSIRYNYTWLCIMLISRYEVRIEYIVCLFTKLEEFSSSTH